MNIGTSGAEIGGAFGGEKKRAVDEAVVMPGNPICDDKPLPLITPPVYHWRRAFNLIYEFNIQDTKNQSNLTLNSNFN